MRNCFPVLVLLLFLGACGQPRQSNAGPTGAGPTDPDRPVPVQLVPVQPVHPIPVQAISQIPERSVPSMRSRVIWNSEEVLFLQTQWEANATSDNVQLGSLVATLFVRASGWHDSRFHEFHWHGEFYQTVRRAGERNGIG